MATYDVAAGSDQTALNTIALSIYKGTYPKVFKGKINVGQLNISYVDYDIQSAPTFSLVPSEQIRAAGKECLAPVFSGAELNTALDNATQATFTLMVSSISMTIYYSDGQSPTTVSGSLQASGRVQTNADGTLSLSISSGTITIPNEPIMSELLNKIAVPQLISYLNQQIFSPITIPPLSFQGVTLTVPQVMTQNSMLLGFASMQPNPVIPPPPGNWPSGVAFIGTDARILNTVANSVLAGVGPSGNWSWGCDIGICNLSLNANYRVAISNAQFNPRPGSGNSLTGSVTLSASAGFSAKCGILGGSFSATASATPTVTASVSAVGSQIFVTLQSLDNISFNFDFSGVPWFIPSAVLTLIANALAPVIAAAVTAAVRGLSFKVYQIPAISVPIAGIQFNIQLVNLALSTISAPDGMPLVTVTGLANVTTTTLRTTVRMTRPGEKDFVVVEAEAPAEELLDKVTA